MRPQALRHSTIRRGAGVGGAAVLSLALAASAALASSPARPASHSEHAALVAAFAKQDGNPSEIRSVQISRSNSSIAVVCVKTPEGGPQDAVFHRYGRSWKLTSSGRPGTTGSASERRLEHVCG